MTARSVAGLVGVLLVTFASVPRDLVAQERALPRVPVLTLEVARSIVGAGREEARDGGWRMVVAVVDAGGHPVVLERMDGAQLGSIDIALEKARAAVRFRRPTAETAEWVQGGALNLLALPGLVPVGGGVPLIVDGVVVGAVGVSGATAAEDGVVAEAAARVLAGIR